MLIRNTGYRRLGMRGRGTLSKQSIESKYLRKSPYIWENMNRYKANQNEAEGSRRGEKENKMTKKFKNISTTSMRREK